MALINCPECNKQVSDKASSCPNCGYPISKCLSEEKKEETVISVDITQECNDIRKILSDFKRDYVPLTGMVINTEIIQQIKKKVDAKIFSLSIEIQKEYNGIFAENFCMGLCENDNAGVLKFDSVKKMCDIIEIRKSSPQSISNMSKVLYDFAETKIGSVSLMPLSWIFYELLNCGSDSDVKLLDSTLEKPNSFDVPRRKDIMDIAQKLGAKSNYEHVATKEVINVNVPKCPTCGSTDLSKVSTLSKAGSVFMFGLLSQKVKKQWHCNNCGSEW